MTRDELAHDLAYVRTLAEEGRYAPLLGGSFLVFWGCLNGTAYVLHWSLQHGYLPGGDTGLGFGVLWGLYGAVAGVGSALLSARVRAKPGKSAIGVRAEGAIWHAAGVAIAAIVIGSIGRMLYEQDTIAPNVIMGAAFALFGAALTGTAMLSGQKWLTSFAIVSFATSALLGVFANAPWAYLLAAAASAIVLIIPGTVLLRREPSAVV